MKINDVIKMHFGPFEATAKVVRIIEAGAVLELRDDAKLVGFDMPVTAPNGDQLTENPWQAFIGRAHWDAAVLVEGGSE